MTLDVDVVRGRCQEIEQSLARLEAIRDAGREAFLANEDAIDIGCYRLLIAIEAALALCYHVSARRLRSVPDDYAGCFESRGAGWNHSGRSVRAAATDGPIEEPPRSRLLEAGLRPRFRCHRAGPERSPSVLAVSGRFGLSRVTKAAAVRASQDSVIAAATSAS
jgi:hypothetical protein